MEISAIGRSFAAKPHGLEAHATEGGLRCAVTTYEVPAAAPPVKQVKLEYDAFHLPVADKQEHDGTVDGSTPSVTYANTDGSDNVLRRHSITAPGGKWGENTQTFVGLAQYVRIGYAEPGVERTYIRESGEPVGDSGDPYMLYQVTDAARGDLNINRTAIGGVPAQEQAFTYGPTGNCPSAARNDLEFRSSSHRGLWNALAFYQWQRTTTAEAGVETLDQSRVHNRDNQLTQIDGSNSGILYDRAGNALRMPPDTSGDWSEGFILTWDAWNRLVTVSNPEGEFVAGYAYDGLFRRIVRLLAGAQTVHTYYNDLWRPVQERIQGGRYRLQVPALHPVLGSPVPVLHPAVPRVLHRVPVHRSRDRP